MAVQTRSNEELTKQFNQTIRELITKAEKRTRSDVVLANLDRAKKRISLVRDTMGAEAVLAEASPFFIEYSEQILNPDIAAREQFFLDLDIKVEYIRRKGAIDQADEFLIDLTTSIKNMFQNASTSDKNDVHNKVKILFDCSLEYGINLESRK